MDDLTAQLERASRLALAARSAAQAGDPVRASRLRAEYDALFDALESLYDNNLEAILAKAWAALAELGAANSGR